MLVAVLIFLLLAPLSFSASWFLVCRAKPRATAQKIPELSDIIQVPLPAHAPFVACADREAEAVFANETDPRNMPCEVHKVKKGEPCPEGETLSPEAA